MASVSFYLRGQTLYCRLNEGRMNNIRFVSKIKIPYGLKWSDNDQVIEGRSTAAYQLNSTIQAAKAFIASLYEKHRNFNIVRSVYERSYQPESPKDLPQPSASPKALMLQDCVSKFIQGAERGSILKHDGEERYSEGSIGNMKTNLAILKEAAQKDIDLAVYNLGDASLTIQDKKRLSDEFTSYFRTIDQHLIERRKLMRNTRSTFWGMLRHIIRYYAEQNFIQIPKPFFVSKEDAPIVVLDPNFVKEFVLDKNQLYSRFRPEEKLIYELAVTILVTTLRVSDAVSLSSKHIEFRPDGSAWLKKPNQKTGAISTSPLPPTLVSMFKANLRAYNSLFTPVKIGNKVDFLERCMPDFFKNYKHTHHPFTISRKDRTGKFAELTQPLYAFIKPHMLRKSAITTMLTKGVDSREVKFLSGHTEDSKAFARYVGFVQQNHENAISTYHKTFLS